MMSGMSQSSVRFIVEMSKTRKVYKNLYVGQNHLFEMTEIYDKFENLCRRQ
jgi:hypothetical protein